MNTPSGYNYMRDNPDVRIMMNDALVMSYKEFLFFQRSVVVISLHQCYGSDIYGIRWDIACN